MMTSVEQLEEELRTSEVERRNMETFYKKERNQKELRISQLEEDVKKRIADTSKLDEKLVRSSDELMNSKRRTTELQARINELKTKFQDSTDQLNNTKRELNKHVSLVGDLKKQIKDTLRKHQEQLVTKDEELTSHNNITSRMDAESERQIRKMKAKQLKMQRQLDKYYFKCIPAWKTACADRDKKIKSLREKAIALKNANLELNEYCKHVETKKDISISKKLRQICFEHWKCRYSEWKKEENERKKLERRIGHLFMGSANVESCLKTWKVQWSEGRPIFGRFSVSERIPK